MAEIKFLQKPKDITGKQDAPMGKVPMMIGIPLQRSLDTSASDVVQ